MTRNAEQKKRQTARAAAREAEKAVNIPESGKDEVAKSMAEAELTRATSSSEESGGEEVERIETSCGMRFAVRPADMPDADRVNIRKTAEATAAALIASGSVAQHLRVGNNVSGMMIFECKEWEVAPAEDALLQTMAVVQLSLDDMATVAIVRNDTSLLKLVADTTGQYSLRGGSAVGQVQGGEGAREIRRRLVDRPVHHDRHCRANCGRKN